VFDPNRTVDERYQSYVAVTDEGRTYVGILAGETANSITLVGQEGKQHTLLRSELEQLSNSGTSLMPEGFEKVLSAPDIADLFAYLAGHGKPPKALTGNEPDGSVDALHPPDATTEIRNLVVDLSVGTPGEYERIPAIWEASIAAGRRNNALELQRLLKFSIPAADEPLHEWRVVVVGGGIINGLSQKGVWPRRRILELLRGNELLLQSWSRMIGLAADMANDESVREGTRYDALRILGADEFKSSGHGLVKYLNADVPPELQMGAISGLSDIESSAATDALLNAFGSYTKKNEQLAIDALLRTEERALALVAAIESGKVARDSLTAEHLEKLPNVEKPAAEQTTREPAVSQ
jgi:hypothetical protein